MPLDMNAQANALRAVLAERDLTHLHVTKRGKALTVHSGPEDDPDPEARLTHLGRDQWRLDFRHHTGRWEQTPFTGTLEEMIELAEGMGRSQDYGA